MKKNYCAIATVAALLSLFGSVGCKQANAGAGMAFANSSSDESDLAGGVDWIAKTLLAAAPQMA